MTVAHATLSALVQLGLRDVVVCPGSRSAPLAYAAAELAELGKLTLHMRLDERSAAFFAMGLAAAGGPPAAVITTSGTAVANLLPAVCEADLAQIPLVCITADRPAEQHGCGANQTMEQRTLMQGRIRRGWNVPADLQGASWRSVPAQVSRLWAAATGVAGGQPGPVHLNVELREPLTGSPAEVNLPAPVVLPSPTHGVPGMVLSRVPRTLVVVGHLAPHERQSAVHVVATSPHPCVVEPATGLGDDVWGPGFVPGGVMALDAADWVALQRPDRIVMVGRPTLSRSLSAVLAHPDTELVVATSGGTWHDPYHRAAQVIHAQSLEWSSVTCADTSRYRDEWVQAGARAVHGAQRFLSDQWPHPWTVAAAVVQACTARGAPLICGPSNPVRAVDLGRYQASCAMFAFRGVAGIDGVLSAAAGIAHQQGGAVALVGDLTFLHDQNTLLRVSGQSRPPLLIVVINDDGGGIFEHLEHADAVPRERFELLFGTATGTNISLLCQASDVPHRVVHTVAQLQEEIAAGASSLRVVEVSVPRDGTARMRAEIRRAVTTAVACP